MTATSIRFDDHAYIEVDSIGPEVALETLGGGYAYVDIRLTPSKAVELSRALVKAAATALGVEPSKRPDPTSGTGTAF